MSSQTLLDPEILGSVTPEQLARIEPFPWHVFDRLLRPEAFRELADTFPDLRLFERHQERPRKSGQRPHNRFYLAYDRDGRDERPGVIGRRGLPAAWRAFLDELERAPYLTQARALLQAEDPQVRVRYAWHVGVRGSEVSPHRDSTKKYGTHVFYFNSRSDWDPAWGGSTLILASPKHQVPNPDFDDFASTRAGAFLDNKSLLFRRTADSWHGVRTLTCPEHSQRRLFNVIFERPG